MCIGAKTVHRAIKTPAECQELCTLDISCVSYSFTTGSDCGNELCYLLDACDALEMSSCTFELGAIFLSRRKVRGKYSA
jgi:hypothetical protein